MTQTIEPTTPTEDSMTRPLLGAGLAVIAWGASSVIAKSTDLGGLALATYRFLGYFVILLAFQAARGVRIPLRVLRDSFPGGLMLALDVGLFFSAVKLTTVVNATLIGALQPIVIGVVAARFFGEQIRLRDAAWSALALLGVVGVVASSGSTAGTSMRGDLLAVGALLAWSAYFITAKRSRGTMTSTEFTGGTAFWAGAINLPFAAALGQDLSMPSTRDIVLLIAMIGFGSVLGHGLMNWSLVRIPLWIGSTFTLLSPVASAAVAWVALGEALNWTQVTGMALVLVSLGVIVRGQATRVPDVVEPVAA